MAKEEKNEKWIQSAITHRGALKDYAKKQNKLTPEGSIDKGWLEKLSSGNNIWGKRAQLAITLDKLGGE